VAPFLHQKTLWFGRPDLIGHTARGLLDQHFPMPDPRCRHLTSFAAIAFCRGPFRAVACLLALGFFPGAFAQASGPERAELKPEAHQAFALYTKLTDARNESELRSGLKLLWIDVLPDKERTEAHAALLHGEIRIQKLQTQDSGQLIRCPGCLFHHWVGVVLIPQASIDDVLGILEDYDHHSTYYSPDVERSKLLSRDGDHFRAFLRFRRHKVITVVLNTEHDIHYLRDSATRAHSRSSATRIAEVENPGKADEREKTSGNDGGFLWGMETWWRIEERDDGVYLQSEVASLTRDIPTGLGWLVGPFVKGIPKETLTFTLEATRQAVQAKHSR
jgi:hypothetical protein